MPTATEILSKHIYEQLGPVPEAVKTQEQYHRWCLTAIDRAARELAQPHIDALVDVEVTRPRKIVWSRDQDLAWLIEAAKPVNE